MILGIALCAVVMTIIAYGLTIMPKDSLSAARVVPHNGLDYRVAPAYREMQAAHQMMGTLNRALQNRSAAIVYRGAVRTDYEAATTPSVGWPPHTALSGQDYLTGGNTTLNPSNFGVGDGSIVQQNSFFLVVDSLALGRLYVFYHHAESSSSGYEFHRVVMRVNGEEQEYRFAFPLAERNWGQSPGAYPALTVNDGIRRIDGPVTVIFPDPYLRTGETMQGAVQNFSRYTYFLSQM